MAPQINLLDAKLVDVRVCADHISVVALRKAREILRRPADIDGWEAFKFETVGDAYLIEGGVPRLLKTGPKRGQKTWRDSRISTLDNLLKLQNLVPPLRALLAAEILPLTVAYALADLHPESQAVAWEAIKSAKNRAVALRKHLDEVASS